MFCLHVLYKGRMISSKYILRWNARLMYLQRRVVKILYKIYHVCSVVHYENCDTILKRHFIDLPIMFICLFLGGSFVP